MLREIRLYGELGRRFGQVHRLAVQSAAEAVRALSANHPGFETYLRENSEPGYKVWVGHERIGEDQLTATTGARVIRISPVIAGEKKQGMGQVILGTILVIIGAVMVYTGVGATAGAYMIKIGAVMILGGIVQLLTPTPKKDEQKESESKQSYSFSGPGNTVAQGNPVPVLYGEMIVGSAVISAGLYGEDVPL